MEKKVALIGSYANFNHAVRGIYAGIVGNKTLLSKGQIIEIEHDGGKVAYCHVDCIEHVMGRIFDEYSHIYGWFNIENVEKIKELLEIRGAKFVEL